MIRLKPTKFRADERHFIGFDIETSNKGIDFLSCALWFHDEVDVFFRDKRETIDCMKRTWFRNSILVATNLMFDWGGLFRGMPEEMQFGLIAKGSRLMRARTHIVANRQFKKHRHEKGKDTHTHSDTLDFWDTMSFSPEGVDSLGKLVNEKKIMPPAFLGIGKTAIARLPNNDEWFVLREYNMMDSIISCKFLKYVREELRKINVPMKMTAGSVAMANFTTNHLDRTLYQPSVDDLLEQFVPYRGGRTEVFRRGEFENVHHFDVKSMYPAIMADILFPNPNTLRRNAKNDIMYLKTYEGMTKCSVHIPKKTEYPLLAFRHANKLTFPVGTLKGWFTNIELRRCLELGYKITDIKQNRYYTETMRPFKYMRELFYARIKYKDEGNLIMAAVMKLLMNSTYGKTAQKFLGMETFEPFTLTIDELNEYEGDLEVIGNYYKVKKDVAPAPFCIPIWAAYVTAAARILIHKFAMKYKAIYIDTDSCFTLKMMPHGDDLGMMEYVGTYTKAMFIKPKCYAVKHADEKCSFRVKGVSTSERSLRYFAGKQTSLISYEDVYRFLSSPNAQFIKTRKLKEAVRSGKPINEFYEVFKQMDIEDTKREWKGKFPSKGNQSSTALYVNEEESMKGFTDYSSSPSEDDIPEIKMKDGGA